ncbi:MAG: two pore domain potassium channel family protein [Firmicutes bacterium]|nr:two pore domain potassium channel family protein [Bacillota bacterium]MBR6504026.1 two pore domain potassium channel family protein [Bacillota bacterium]
MRRLKILGRILKETRADRLLWGFLGFILICGLIIWIREPGIDTYRGALWYCYSVITTIGFGDVLVTTPLSRALSIVLSVYAVLVIAIVTGVVVKFYNEVTDLRNKETLASFMDRLEHLPEMNREELEEMSEQVKKFRKK